MSRWLLELGGLPCFGIFWVQGHQKVKMGIIEIIANSLRRRTRLEDTAEGWVPVLRCHKYVSESWGYRLEKQKGFCL